MSLVPPASSPIVAGYRLDRYELLCPIAEGGMASVWIARQTGKHGFQRFVAIKTILPKYAAEPSFQNMFIDEARIASRIEHTNVTQILDVGEQHGVTYLVMEYVDGDALSKIHRAAKKKGVKIPLGVLLRIVADVCGGLHAAHELRDDQGQPMNVVHRDVSPQNVLVTTRGVAKLIDFGIAKARDRLAGETHADTLKGKVQYMPPEQALGRPVDRRADVWSVGAVLYHLIAGRPPFEADNEIQTLFQITSGRPPAPLPPSVPEPVRAVVRKALAQKLDERYASAAELQQAIEDVLAASLTTSTSTIAAFLEEMVGERAKKRKEAIAFGLKAAEEREKAAALMRSNADQTGQTNVTSDTGARIAVAAARAGEMGAGSGASDPTTSPTGQTIGSTAMSVPLMGPRRGMALIVAGAVGALLLLGIVILVAARSSSGEAAAGVVAPSSQAAGAGTARPGPSIPPPPAPSASVAESASAQPDEAPVASEATATEPSPAWHPRPHPAPAQTAAKPASTTTPTPTRNNYGF